MGIAVNRVMSMGEVVCTRVGIDLVRTEQVREALAAHGRRYLDRIYTVEELRDCGSDAQRLAARFAAKEAAMKALGRSDEPLPWRSIGVCRGAGGCPSLQLSGAAAELAQSRGVRRLSVSLTHEGTLAAAVVLAEEA
jgi:holo-[acyl-carrier protein] synthase